MPVWIAAPIMATVAFLALACFCTPTRGTYKEGLRNAAFVVLSLTVFGVIVWAFASLTAPSAPGGG